MFSLTFGAQTCNFDLGRPLANALRYINYCVVHRAPLDLNWDSKGPSALRERERTSLATGQNEQTIINLQTWLSQCPTYSVIGIISILTGIGSPLSTTHPCKLYLMSSKISGFSSTRVFILSFMATMIALALSSAPCFALFSAAPRKASRKGKPVRWSFVYFFPSSRQLSISLLLLLLLLNNIGNHGNENTDACLPGDHDRLTECCCFWQLLLSLSQLQLCHLSCSLSSPLNRSYHGK